MKKARTFALTSGFVLILGFSGQGCDQNPCDDIPGGKGGLMFSDSSGTLYICRGAVPEVYVRQPPPPPPPPPPAPPSPPDVSGFHPADKNGARDPDAVVSAAIVLDSCWGYTYFFKPQVSRTIASIYYANQRDRTLQAMFDRSECFKGKQTGCDALRECLGLVQTVNGAPQLDVAPDPALGQGCVSGSQYIHEEFVDYRDIFYKNDIWLNCEGLGLECRNDYLREWCAPPRTPCDPNIDKEPCPDDRPFGCKDRTQDGQYYSYQQPKCSDFGLTCNPDWGPGWPDCVGVGSACGDPTDEQWVFDEAVFHYETGIACESATELRVCVGRGEKLIDCTSLAQGFTCIDGEKPHCGFASECNGFTPATCEGDSLVVCDGGRFRKVDCKSLGFTSCDAKHGVCSPGIYDNVP